MFLKIHKYFCISLLNYCFQSTLYKGSTCTYIICVGNYHVTCYTSVINSKLTKSKPRKGWATGNGPEDELP